MWDTAALSFCLFNSSGEILSQTPYTQHCLLPNPPTTSRIKLRMTQQTIARKQLLLATLGSRNLTSVDVREIRMEPGQQAGRHLHPCAVVGYITQGTAVFRVEGAPEQTLAAGSAFYEPADTIISNFGNASHVEPMTFVAFYLLDGEQELIRMLD
jgi:quercetin dioxygenase-like cupin family protein